MAFRIVNAAVFYRGLRCDHIQGHCFPAGHFLVVYIAGGLYHLNSRRILFCVSQNCANSIFLARLLRFLVGWEIIYPVAIGLTGDISFKSLPTSSIIKLFVIACLMFPQYVAIFLYAWGDTRKRETKSGKEKKG